ncbi:MAG: hypothetical protein E7194_02095 [Erysipelotrichaceae bacterium]|nr:hypothetical protein [Erysipelotrichaceae bacterium]
MSMLTFEQFQDELSAKCRLFAETQGGISVVEQQVNKLNASYPSITMMREGRDMGVCFNLNDLYGMYICDHDLEKVFFYVKTHMDDEIKGLERNAFLDYEQVRDLLFIRVSNAAANAYLLSSAPHRIIEEFAITYHVMVQNDADTLGSALITWQLMETYGVEEEQLYRDAMRSAQKLFAPDVLKYNGPYGWSMFMVTNQKQLNGASVMFYPGFAEKLLESVGEDMYVIPSSIHEMMIFPASLYEDAAYLKEVLHDANRDCCMPGEVLSENVYFLSSIDRTLRKLC